MLMRCNECGGRVASSAHHCPHCGSHFFYPQNPVIKGAAIVVFDFAALVIFSVFAGMFLSARSEGPGFDDRHFEFQHR